MYRKFSILFALILLVWTAQAQSMKVVAFDELEKEIRRNGDTLTVVNFWATWCAPCIAEMKYFAQAQDAYKGRNVKFVYVSLDFSKNSSDAEKVATTKGLKGERFLLKDDPNLYVTKVDKNWEGQIPVTLLVKSDKSYVMHYAQFTSYEELDHFIKAQLK